MVSVIQIRIAELSAITKLHGNTVREHLNALAKTGLVRHRVEAPLGTVARARYRFISIVERFDDLDGKRTAQSLTSNWYRLAEDSGARLITQAELLATPPPRRE